MKNVCLFAALCMTALGLSACDESPSAQLGSRNFDKIDAGRVGDGRTATYFMYIRDRQTGCQYIASGWTDYSLTPRLDASGKPMCGI